MKQVLIQILSLFFQSLNRLLCSLRLKHPKVIVYMDGGICSQMLIYLHGQYYKKYGIDVYYDIQWFDTCGKDQFGNMPRFFELKEMWPNMEIQTLSNFQRKWYLLFFSAKRTNGNWLPNPEDVKHSIYLYEYWDIPEEAYHRLCAEYYDIHKAAVPNCVQSIDFNGTVGIHVRRGDLAKGDNPYYGGVSEGYFMRAIEFCNEKFTPKKYIFFSDDPDWVEYNICPHLTQPYEIMRGNKAWEDLWLLAHCPMIIASQGSFGKVAAQINPEAILIQCDNEHAVRGRVNNYYIG